MRWVLGGSWGEDEDKNWRRDRQGWVAVGVAVKEDPICVGIGGSSYYRGSNLSWQSQQCPREESASEKRQLYSQIESNKALSLS